MAVYFLDTSAHVKHFHLEVGSDRIDAIFAELDSSRFISQLGAAEIISALATKIRMGELESPNLGLAKKQLLNEVSRRQVDVIRVLTRHFRQGEVLLQKHSTIKRLRTSDAIQLAIATDLSQRLGDVQFVCADRILGEVAREEGLTWIDPLQ
jgi:predicted nucleic acid-binding protein